MMTSSNGTFSALLALCAGNSPVPGAFPAQRPVTRSFDVFFDLRPNKRLSKQPRGWWFETLSSPLWRHRNGCQHVRYCGEANIACVNCWWIQHAAGWLMNRLLPGLILFSSVFYYNVTGPISNQTSYRKISRNLEAARYKFKVVL